MNVPGASIEIVSAQPFALDMATRPAPVISISSPAPAVIEVAVAAIGPRGFTGGPGERGPEGPPVDTGTLTIDGGYF